MRTIRFLALAVALGVSGCAKETPKCSDDQATNLARELFAKQLSEFAGKITGTTVDPKEMATKLRLDLPRASSFDEKIKKYVCEATLVDADGRKMSVSYTSQLDDHDEHLVSVPALSETLGSALMEGLFTQPKKQDPVQGKSAEKQEVPDLSKYVGQEPTSVFKEPIVHDKFKALLGNDFDHFETNLSVSSGITEQDGYYFGDGNAPHLGGVEEAAFVISKQTGEVVVIFLVEGKSLKWAGVQSERDLPAPLLAWYKDHGGQ